MVKVLLVNYTDVPLKYFVRSWEGGLIAPEQFNTVYPQSKKMVSTSSGREILLRWTDIDNGNSYGESYILENDITLVVTFNPETALFHVRSFGGIRPEKGSMVEEARFKPRKYKPRNDPRILETFI